MSLGGIFGAIWRSLNGGAKSTPPPDDTTEDASTTSEPPPDPASPIPEQKGSCVIIGPVGAGKTALVSTLRQCASAKSHSYAGRFTASVHGMADYEDLGERLLQREAVLATWRKVNEVKFSLIVTTETDLGDFQKDQRFAMKFSTMDAGGEVLLERVRKEDLEADPYLEEIREKLRSHLYAADNVIICLPVRTKYATNHLQIKILSDVIADMSSNAPGKRIVVCFTKYEQAGLEYRNDAFRVLASRSVARQEMRDAFNQIHDVFSALRYFPGDVYCTPLSAYGFIPYHGGPNSVQVRVSVPGEEEVEGYDDVLRIHATSRKDPQPAYSEEDARRYWAPFLTLDPFIFLATGHRENTLIHHLSELLD